MNAVFADTFFWVALANHRDSRHHEARRLDWELGDTPVFTTDEVLDEFLTFFAGDPALRVSAVVTVERLLSQSGYVVVAQTRQSFLDGLDLYRSRPDKGYSLTDCISMSTMRRHGITDVLTYDQHFVQEGFRAIFRRHGV
jgi:predicted nucleic acid-binding protein